MKITLFVPGKQPVSFTSVSYYGFAHGGRIMPKQHKVAELLRSQPSLVDLLAIGTGYAIYAVFDHDGQLNPLAMKAFTQLTGVAIEEDCDEDVLRGPVVTLEITQ